MRTIVIACLTLMFGAMPAQAADEPTPPSVQDSVPEQKIPEPQLGQKTSEPQLRTDCLRETGTRIRPPKGKCLPQAGRTYNYDQIHQTGANDAGQALRQLDPSVTVGR